MKSSGKIIIKPRATARNVTAVARAVSEAESEAQQSQPQEEENETENDQVEDADDENDNANNDDNDESQNQQDDGEDGEDGTSAAADDQEEDEEEEEEAEEEEAAPTPAKRGRGRPKGSFARSSGTSTPRGRLPKIRGRPRGRPRSTAGGAGLTIRLKAPKGEGEEGSDEEVTTEAESIPVPVAAEGEADGETKEAPMGGGKPFRKIGEKVYVIDGDEFVTDDDPKGDQKVDKWGNLLGGRKFKASTFILPNRHPQRQYMLAIDAARTSGFRDSLYYFRRNPLAFKLNATQPEKDYLISEGKLGSHLRTRSVTLITAKSAFKLHGSKMIIDGRWVTDDYYEEKVLAEITAKGLQAGDLVGELPDPNAPAHPRPELDSLANSAFGSSNANIAGGGGGIYRAGGPTTIFGGSGWGPFSDGPLNAVRKSLLSRDNVTEENWMWMMAGRVGEADDEWARLRKESRGRPGLAVDGVVIGGRGSAWEKPDTVMEDLKAERGTQSADVSSTDANATRSKRKRPDDEGALGAYEPHTNLVFYRTDTQPTRAKWQPVPNSSKPRILGGTKAGNGAWSIAWVDTLMQLPEEDQEAQAERTEEQRERETMVKEAEDTLIRSASIVSGRGESAIPRGVSVASTRGMSVGM